MFVLIPYTCDDAPASLQGMLLQQKNEKAYFAIQKDKV